MPASLRKYYKRSHKLILTLYSKLKDNNKKACDLMLHYNEDLRKAHKLKNGFTVFVKIQSTLLKLTNGITEGLITRLKY